MADDINPFGGGSSVNLTQLATAAQATTQAINNLNQTLASFLPLIFVGAPAATTSAGTAGQVAYDTGFFYVCIATNTWRRTALSTW